MLSYLKFRGKRIRRWNTYSIFWSLEDAHCLYWPADPKKMISIGIIRGHLV